MAEQVNHPQHYNGREDGLECIDVIRYYIYDIGAAIKYLWRAGLKHSAGKTDREKEIEDLRKALWYVRDHYEKEPDLLLFYDKKEMELRVRWIIKYDCDSIVSVYESHVAKAMRNLLLIGLVYLGKVSCLTDRKEALAESIEHIEKRIKDLENQQ